MTLPVLYIIMRNDLASMNPGKAAAQASHASNAFVGRYHGYCQELSPISIGDMTKLQTSTIKGFGEWERSTNQHFGTVLVLEGKIGNITNTIDIFKSLDYIADVIHDPTYPIVDGEIVHHIPLNTCGYVFVPDKETDVYASALLGQYPLCK